MDSKMYGKVKQKFFHEITVFYLYTFFLYLLFGTFITYERLLLGYYGNSHIRYGYSLLEALILAKVIMIGEAAKIGEKYKYHPLIIPVIYKTLAFSLLLLIFNLLEHYIIGYFAGRTFMQTYYIIMHQKMNIMLAKTFIMIIIFAQFFVMLELSRALGENKLAALFFKKRSHADNYENGHKQDKVD